MQTKDGMKGHCPVNRGYFDRQDAKVECKWTEKGRIGKRLDISCKVPEEKLLVSENFNTSPKKQEEIMGIKNFAMDGEEVRDGSSRQFTLEWFGYTSERDKPDTHAEKNILTDEICDVMDKILSKSVSGLAY